MGKFISLMIFMLMLSTSFATISISSDKIKTIDDLSNFEEVFYNKSNQTIHEGWPKSLELKVDSPVVIADLDGDKRQEIIVATNEDLNGDPKVEIYVWAENGSLLDGWPKSIDGWWSQVSAGDINNDGDLEIVCSSIGNGENNLHVWKHDGSYLDNWPKNLDVWMSSLSDINNDGYKEIICSEVYGVNLDEDQGIFLNVLNYKGQQLPGQWSNFELTSSISSVGNIDEDAEKELVFQYFNANNNEEYTKYVTVLNSEGKVKNGWPKEINDHTYAINLGDIDNDGFLEIITDDDQKIHVFNSDGSYVPGWPIELPEDFTTYPSAIGDVDGDNSIDIVIAGSEKYPNTQLYAYNTEGKVLPGFPIDRESDGRFITSPILADLDDDGDQEIIIGCTTGLLSYDSNGDLIWSLEIDEDTSSENEVFSTELSQSPAIGDIDKDGCLEVIFVTKSGKVYIWDLEGPHGFLSWPQDQHDAQHTGCYSEKETPIANNDTSNFNEDSLENIINVLENDEGTNLVITNITEPKNGIIKNNIKNISYTPNPNYFGYDSFVYTIENDHGESDSAIVNINIKNINDLPNKPEKPVGPTDGIEEMNYEFNFTTTDPDNDTISYFIDWDDETNSEWVGPYGSGDVCKVSHIFNEAGSYNIKAKAKDIYGNQSIWSEPLIIEILNKNSPPEAPDTLQGPTSGKIREECTYKTSTTDPDGDQIYYLFYWGDGNESDWLGPYDSGAIVEESHIWGKNGTYAIMVKSKDEVGEESDFSQEFKVIIKEDINSTPPDEPSPPSASKLEVTIDRGLSFRAIKAAVINKDDVVINNINFSLSVKPVNNRFRFLDFNISKNRENINLDPEEIFNIEINGFIGFGKISITARASYYNTIPVEKTVTGQIFRGIIFLPKNPIFSL